MYALKILRKLLTRRDKGLLLLLIAFAVFVSFMELIGISAVIPFLSMATDFSVIDSNKYYSFAYKALSFDSKPQFIITFGLLLIVFYFLRSFINLLYAFSTAKFSHSIYLSLASRLFNKFYNMSYLDFTKINASYTNKTIISETRHLLNFISALLVIFSEIIVILALYLFMLYIDYVITLFLTLFLILNSILMFKIITKRIRKAGNVREKTQKEYYEIISSTLGNFKLLKLYQNNLKISDKFYTASKSYVKANVYHASLSPFPRFYLEALGFSIVIAIVVYLIWRGGIDISYILPIASAFILALFRLLPSFNRIMSSLNIIAFYYNSLNVVNIGINKDSEKLGSEKITFNNSILLKNVDFAYEKNKKILTDINLHIKKGDRIAFIGKSGSGKSTLVDIIIGICMPSSGNIIIDSAILNDKNIKQWRDKIGYIPQSIYLFDGKIRDNVTLGSKYDRDKVDDCLKKANIYDFLQTKQGQDTFVGERGILLSGGQKQRIAIARALYRDPEIIVLDEATSALDIGTERKIMQEIYKIAKHKTLIIVAHRMSTISQCNIVYELKEGTINQTQ